MISSCPLILTTINMLVTAEFYIRTISSLNSRLACPTAHQPSLLGCLIDISSLTCPTKLLLLFPKLLISVNNNTIPPFSKAKHFGNIIDFSFSFIPHIKSFSKCSFIYLQNTFWTHFLPTSTSTTLIYGTIITYLDLHSGHLTDLPASLLLSYNSCSR